MPSIYERISSLFYKSDKDKRALTQYPHGTKDQEPEISAINELYRNLQISNERLAAYKDYDAMDTDIVASALDLFADDATQMNLLDGYSFYIESPDKEIKRELEHLFYEVLDIQEYLWDITRMFAKYGDFFLRVHGEQKIGVQYLDYNIHPSQVTRYDERGLIKGFEYHGKQYHPWDFVHFRLPGTHYDTVKAEADAASCIDDSESIVYGVSCIDRARKVWKQLNAIENSMVLSRIARSQKRNIFTVDVGHLTEPKAWELVRKYRDVLKKHKSYNVSTGSMNTSMALNPDEDIIFPVSEEKGSLNVQEIGGNAEVSGIADVDYLNNKLFAALRTPKAFLGFEESLNGRNTLRMLDVRYARTVKNLQRVLILGLDKLARIHLSFLDKDPVTADFTIRLPYISTIEETEKAEILQLKAQSVESVISVINTLDSDFASVNKTALLSKVLKRLEFSEEEIADLIIPEEVEDGVE